MIVAFLDLLGFSHMVEEDIVAANDLLIAFNEKIKNNYFDYKVMGKRSDDVDLYKNSFTSSFKRLISVSDSLIIGSDDPDTFISQLCNFVATLFIQYNAPFAREFKSIRDVNSNHFMSYENSRIRSHKAYPILFRGGISYGDEVFFFQ